MWGGERVGWGVGLGGQGGCEQRSEVFVIFFFLGGGSGRVGGVGLGGQQGRCERRSEVFVKFPKKKYFFLVGGRVRGGGGGRGVRVDVNREVEFL